MNKLVSTAGFTLGATIIFSVVTLSQTLRITPTPIKIFDTPITVNIYENTSKPKSRITFVSLHHNEQVGLKLVKEAIKKRGGKLVEVVSASGSNPQRYLHFKYKERSLCVDPNRIFSKKGVASSLARIAAGDEGCENNLNDQTKAIIKEATVVSMIEDFQVKLTNLFKPIKSTEVLVSVHNNKLNGSINVRSFIKKGDPEYDNNQATYIVRDDMPKLGFRKIYDDDGEEMREDWLVLVNSKYSRVLHFNDRDEIDISDFHWEDVGLSRS